MADRQGAIPVGQRGLAGRHETMARHAPHGGKYGWIFDAARDDRLMDHLLTLRFSIAIKRGGRCRVPTTRQQADQHVNEGKTDQCEIPRGEPERFHRSLDE